MATPSLRLTFLYPHLFRSLRASEPIAQTARRQCRRNPHAASRRVAFGTTVGKEQRFVERHGKAVEPFLVPGETKEDTRVFVPENSPALTKDKMTRDASKSGAEGNLGAEKDLSIEQSRATSSAPLSERAQAEGSKAVDSDTGESGKGFAREPQPMQPTVFSTAEKSTLPENSTEKVVDAENVKEEAEDELNLPHLHPAPYVHNFDSYTLVKEVEKGGFTPEQAITAMKAVRMLLANNLEVAKKGLVSKSDVENQSYLFRAACSELRTEVQNTRKASDEKMRRERAQLQNEVETLNQKLTQDLLTLKDDLQGMFNDRKMAVRMEQREMDSGIQQLNYKITVALNSDSKSEVEGLRWVLSRRSVLAIVFMAFMVLSSLRFASYRAHEDMLEQKRQEKLRESDAAQRARHKDGEGMADSETQTEGDGSEGVEKKELPAGTAAETLSAC